MDDILFLIERKKERTNN